MAIDVRPNESFNYYVGTTYYTNYEIFLANECQLISGSQTKGWQTYVREKYGRLGSAFVFSCGNGWVERGLFQLGAIDRVVGFDIMKKHVEEASEEAKKIGLPGEYFLADGNTFEPNGVRSNVVVNSGAMHHLAYINRFTQKMAEVCENGIYVGHDYTGAHRNQYSLEVWVKVIEVFNRLPEKYRIPLRYPHMKTMLAVDPSEAIHSELQVETLLRHFDVLEYARLGGGISHTLLMNNHRLYAERHTEEGHAACAMILREDRLALQSNPDFNLFSFFVAKPKTHNRASASQLLVWQAEENEREERASRNAGRYYPPTPLETIYGEMAEIEYKLNLTQAP
jgi:SAM-dependent methyltransferase